MSVIVLFNRNSFIFNDNENRKYFEKIFSREVTCFMFSKGADSKMKQICNPDNFTLKIANIFSKQGFRNIVYGFKIFKASKI